MAFPIDTLGWLLEHSGLMTGREIAAARRAGRVLVNRRRARPGDPTPSPGDVVSIRGFDYRVSAGGGQGRLQLVALAAQEPSHVAAPVRVHCGLHKCLTMFSRGVYGRACTPPVMPRGSFRHFYHRVDAFYRECARHTVTSVSGHALELERFDDVRVVRFVRDPRDLVISGYFYHKRGAEHWAELVDPTDVDWTMVRGTVPGGLPSSRSFRAYLEAVSMEEGLLAEMEFRRRHFESMSAWPDDDERIRTFRYEDVLGREALVFDEILSWFDLPWLARRAGSLRARRSTAARRVGKSRHIRDPASGQWRSHFTPTLRERFSAEHGGLLARLGYPTD
jgi:hypothetical protein